MRVNNSYIGQIDWRKRERELLFSSFLFFIPRVIENVADQLRQSNPNFQRKISDSKHDDIKPAEYWYGIVISRQNIMAGMDIMTIISIRETR